MPRLFKFILWMGPFIHLNSYSIGIGYVREGLLDVNSPLGNSDLNWIITWICILIHWVAIIPIVPSLAASGVVVATTSGDDKVELRKLGIPCTLGANAYSISCEPLLGRWSAIAKGCWDPCNVLKSHWVITTEKEISFLRLLNVNIVMLATFLSMAV